MNINAGPAGPGTTGPNIELDLSWTAVYGATGYDIQREPQNGAWEDIAQVSTTSYQDLGLWGNFGYNYQVSAYNSGGESEFSASSLITTPKALPENPDANSIQLSNSSVELVWRNNASDESDFLIMRADDTTQTYINIATVQAGSDYYVDTTVQPNVNYVYEIIAQNSVGDSIAGGTAINTQDNGGSPGTPVVAQAVQLYLGLETETAQEMGPDGNPNDAFIEFSRTGDVSQQTAVAYSVDSSAGNAAAAGYEYQALPGSVTFAPGQFNAIVPVVPLEINHVEETTTVSVHVMPGAGYTVPSPSPTAMVNIANTDIEVAWNTDDNGPNLEHATITPASVTISPGTMDNLNDLGSTFGGAGATVDWGDGDIDSGSLPHFYDSGNYNVDVVADNRLIANFVVNVDHTSNAFDPANPAAQPVYESDSGTIDAQNPQLQPMLFNPPLPAGPVPVGPPSLINDIGPLPATPEEKELCLVAADIKGHLDVDPKTQVFVCVFDVRVSITPMPDPSNPRQRSWTCSKFAILQHLTRQPDGWYVGPGGYDAGAQIVRGWAGDQQVQVVDDGSGNLTVTTLDKTKLTYKKDGDFGTLVIQRPGEQPVNVAFKSAYKQIVCVDAQGFDITDIDRLDSPTFDTIVEEKNGAGLLLVPPAKLAAAINMWITTQIADKAAKIFRISTDATSLRKGKGYMGAAALPPLASIKAIHHLRFEISAASLAVPGLQAAVSAAIASLRAGNPGWTIDDANYVK